MKKTMSVLLVAVMLLAILPMCFISASAAGAPATLPDVNVAAGKTEWLFKEGTEIKTNMTDWNEASMLGENATAAMVNAPYGVTFTVDATQSAANAVLGVTFCLQVKWNGGSSSTYLAPTPYGASINNSSKTEVPTKDMVSTWYVSWDGGAWQQMDIFRDGSGGRYAELAVGGKVAYVYVPMSEFWTKDSAALLRGESQQAAKEHCVDFETFESIVGKDYYLSMNKFSWGGTLSSDSTVKLTDFKFVSCDHEWADGDVITEATHLKKGSKNVTCSKCSTSDVALIDKLEEHEWVWEEDGLENHKASCPCGAEAESAPHNYGDVVVRVPATHTSLGISQQVCDECGKENNQDIQKLTEHEWEYEYVDADTHNKVCDCDEVDPEALPHNWDAGVVTTEPTVETEGVKTFTCADCGGTKTEAIAKLPAPETDDKEDSGCGSVVGSGFAMMAILSGAAVMLTKKKRK